MILHSFTHVPQIHFTQKYQRFHYNNVILDFWCGAELNPHLFGFEIKEFSYRPAFVFIALINMSATAKQYDIYGTVFLPMALFQIISAFYAIDALMFESGLITMFDIIGKLGVCDSIQPMVLLSPIIDSFFFALQITRQRRSK